MGFIHDVLDEDCSIETRRESFIIRSPANDPAEERAEFYYHDIPSLRRALDLAEAEHPELVER